MAERISSGLLEECRVVSLPQIPEPRGNLTALEELVHFPFRIRSVRWFYDLPAGGSWQASEARPGDALIVALKGSFDVVFGQRHGSRRVRLTRADTGLHVPRAVSWAAVGASSDPVGLVISSQSTRQRRPESNPSHVNVGGALNQHTTIDDCRLLTLTRHRGLQGTSTEAIPQVSVPFEIPRVYYLYDIPDGASRGGHAHRGLEQIVVAAAGSFDVTLTDGRRDKTIRLDQAQSGVYIATEIWRELRNFSSGAVCVTLASAPYDEADYIRDFDEFQREKASRLRADARLGSGASKGAVRII
jgi:hypothetical protein